MVPVNKKRSNNAQPLSPPSLKRLLEDDGDAVDEATMKKIKTVVDKPEEPSKNLASLVSLALKEPTPLVQVSIDEKNKTINLVRRISQDDIRGKLKKLKPEVNMLFIVIAKLIHVYFNRKYILKK